MDKPMLEYRARCRECGQWTEDAMDADTLEEIQAKLGNPPCPESGCGGTCDIVREPYPYHTRD